MASTPRPGRRRLRRAGIALGLLVAGMLALWSAIHRIPGLGPALAEAARSVVGPQAVAAAEDVAYDLDDRWRRLWYRGEKPQAYWDVPPAAATATTAPSPAATTSAGDASASANANASAGDPAAKAGPAPSKPASFRPTDVPAMNASFAAPGDGVWVPIIEARRPNEPTGMWKTLLHPDPSRSWTAVIVVAVDLERVDLHLVAGRREPESMTPESKGYVRTGLVAPEHKPLLLAAFNGGYRSIHGKYGMKIDGVVLMPGRGYACTVSKLDDGRLDIRPWEAMPEIEARTIWWRQTPKCMFHDGKPHAALNWAGDKWGAAPSGSTVIRRSAIGLAKDGRVLYVAIGDHTTADAIARAMNHAGAHHVAQLDVNFSYPKFLLFEPREPGSQELVAVPIAKGFEYTEDEYVTKPAQRDFFYLARKSL